MKTRTATRSHQRFSAPTPLVLGVFVLLSCAAATPATPARIATPANIDATQEMRVALPVPARHLDDALDSVSAEQIRSDIFFIASDELGGRDTPSLGQRIAARYIRARLQRLGWKPGAKDGYFFEYPLARRKIDEDASRVEWSAGAKTETLRYGRDYFLPSSFDVEDMSVSADVVFCGAGSTAEFEQAGASGKWALCFDAGTEIRKLKSAARAAKTAGLLVAPGPDYAGEPYADRFAADLERQRRGSVSWPGKARKDAEKDAFAELMLTRDALRRLLGAGKSGASPDGAGLTVGTVLPVSVAETRKIEGEVKVEDVCGFWPGSDPELAKETILVSAHYDHIGTKNGVVYNGADDNGSGTCGLMAIAQALSRYGPMRRSVMLIWVSGEEKGLWGSQAWTEHPWLPDECRAVCDINIDMIGRNAPDKLLITPTSAMKAQYNGLVRIAESVAPLEGFPTLGSCDQYWRRSDHKNFAENLKIPVTFLFSDVHDDYHEPTDDPEKIDNDKVRRVVRLVVRMLDAMQADRLEL